MSRFTVEFGDERNGQQIIKSLGKVRVRGHYSASKLSRAHNIGEKMAGMPDIPGQCMEVDITKKTARVFDPLESQPELLNQINHVSAEAVSLRSSGTVIVHVPEVTHTLDDDHFKSLLMELRRKRVSDCLRVVDGQLPAESVIEKLPGRELSFRTSAHAPRYKDEVMGYERSLDMQRGIS